MLHPSRWFLFIFCGLLAIKILNRRPQMTRRLPPEQLSFSPGAGFGTQYSKTLLSRKRTLQPSAIKRTPHGSRFSLSLDVPTKILSILIDLAKARDMRAKAAANAELMARIGRRK
uniref:Corticotropin-releasing factor domain-containing protein n=1 Tax=Erpetoichthys calabaricus TaxID=27687 RepID=A0A8C4TLM4_ERPCA